MKRSWIKSATTLLFASVISAQATSAPGDLVTGFGDDGVTILSPRPETYAADLAVDVQDRSYVLVSSYLTANSSINRLYRLGQDGLPDVSYSQDGAVVIVSDPDTVWTQLSLSPDGSAALFGISYPPGKSLRAVRIDGTGEQSGEPVEVVVEALTTAPLMQELLIMDVGPTVDGGYFVAGRHKYVADAALNVQRESFLVKLTPDLDLDPDFAPIILRRLDSLKYEDFEIGDDGSLWVLGYASDSTFAQSVLFKFMPDGRPDLAFGTDGVLEFAPESGELSHLTVTPFGGLRVKSMPVTGMPTVLGFNADGSVDEQYGLDGAVDLGDGWNCDIVEMRSLPDGGLQIVGFADLGGVLQFDLCLAQIDRHGMPETAFGGDGMVQMDVHLNEVGWDFSFAANGDVIALSDTYFFDAATYSATPIVTRHRGLFPDAIPQPLDFEAQVGVPARSLRTSAAMVVSGLGEGVMVPVEVENGEYRVSGGEWSRARGWVANGDQVAVRHTSANTPGSTRETSLVMGGWPADDSESLQGETTTTVFRSTVRTVGGSGVGGGGGGGVGGGGGGGVGGGSGGVRGGR